MTEDQDAAHLQSVITNHLAGLERSFESYFCDLRGDFFAWMRQPFLCSVNNQVLPTSQQQQPIELQGDGDLKVGFNSTEMVQFWGDHKMDYLELHHRAIKVLVPFASTYLCEAAFSALVNLKTKYRNRLKDVGHDQLG